LVRGAIAVGTRRLAAMSSHRPALSP